MGFVVAIDGPAAAGKGTIARQLSAYFGFAYLDTGLIYRAVGSKVLADIAAQDFAKRAEIVARALTPEDLAADNLRNLEVAQAASKVAALPNVREELVHFQRSFARQAGGSVLDGRDIGTVICPDADVKLFVTASEHIRAERRFKELIQKGEDTTFADVLLAMRERDTRDRARDVAPLEPASDALVLDTSDLTIELAVRQAIEHVEATRRGTH